MCYIVNMDPYDILIRFEEGLREDIQRELFRHNIYSLEQAYRVAQNYERSLRHARSSTLDLNPTFTSLNHIPIGPTPSVNQTFVDQPSSVSPPTQKDDIEKELGMADPGLVDQNEAIMKEQSNEEELEPMIEVY